MYSNFQVPVGEALHLDTALKGARIRTSGLGTTTTSVNHIVTSEVSSAFAADLRLVGTGVITSAPGGSSGPVNGFDVTVTTEHLSRGGTWSGTATIDGASICGPAGTGIVDLLHTSTVTVSSPLP